MVNPLLEDIEKTFAECLEIARDKNADYAGEENPFKSFLGSELIGISPDKACLVRILDKVTRIGNLLNRPAKVKDETIEDTLNDLINYTAILKALIKELKKK